MLGKKVMIVEDSNTVRYEVRLLLQKTGITLIEVANQIGMFNVLNEFGKGIELIIMDLTLKDEDGFDLIEKLRTYEEYANIPVLVLTEHADKANVMKAKEIGVSGYIRKPIKKDELLIRVNSILSSKP